MKTFRLIYAAAFGLWLASGIGYGFDELWGWFFWAAGLILIAEISAKLTRKKYE